MNVMIGQDGEDKQIGQVMVGDKLQVVTRQVVEMSVLGKKNLGEGNTGNIEKEGMGGNLGKHGLPGTQGSIHLKGTEIEGTLIVGTKKMIMSK